MVPKEVSFLFFYDKNVYYDFENFEKFNKKMMHTVILLLEINCKYLIFISNLLTVIQLDHFIMKKRNLKLISTLHINAILLKTVPVTSEKPEIQNTVKKKLKT